ncbi:hypothetical protein ABVF11_07960 [Pediococcus argentinicus]|uniref:hypothetical protein n=1 Tax=Pediococcus argentinicus TaxID=480391 RepID=UPI00338E150A
MKDKKLFIFSFIVLLVGNSLPLVLRALHLSLIKQVIVVPVFMFVFLLIAIKIYQEVSK